MPDSDPDIANYSRREFLETSLQPRINVGIFPWTANVGCSFLPTPAFMLLFFHFRPTNHQHLYMVVSSSRVAIPSTSTPETLSATGALLFPNGGHAAQIAQGSWHVSAAVPCHAPLKWVLCPGALEDKAVTSTELVADGDDTTQHKSAWN